MKRKTETHLNSVYLNPHCEKSAKLLCFYGKNCQCRMRRSGETKCGKSGNKKKTQQPIAIDLYLSL